MIDDKNTNIEQKQYKYKFDWSLLGDIDAGRPNLGGTADLRVYRLMMYTFREQIEKRLGTEATDEIFYESGRQAGKQIYKNIFQPSESIGAFISQTQKILKELRIGILRVEESDIANSRFILTVSEDLDCSGLPVLDSEICVYDEGFISGLLEAYSGNRFNVSEIDCWCTGDRTCRFKATIAKE